MLTTSDANRRTEAGLPDDGRKAAHALDHASGIGRKYEASLRFAVGAMERQVLLLGTHATTKENASTVGGIISAWSELVDELALGPAPDVRPCPACGRLGMSAATLCGFCWTPLTPSDGAAGHDASDG